MVILEKAVLGRKSTGIWVSGMMEGLHVRKGETARKVSETKSCPQVHKMHTVLRAEDRIQTLIHPVLFLTDAGNVLCFLLMEYVVKVNKTLICMYSPHTFTHCTNIKALLCQALHFTQWSKAIIQYNTQ
jgi:hypothetical protein